MGRLVNAPFLRARPLGLEQVGPARGIQQELALEGPQDDDRPADDARRRKTPVLRRRRMLRPPQG